jgi:hypothetical protein
MVKPETTLISQWYDFEAVRALSVSCECGLPIPDDVLERLTDESPYVCQCGRIVRLSELDDLADTFEWRISELAQC